MAAKKKNSTLSSSIVATLKERIIAWQYPPEHRLTEEGLCREFRVSRSPVREALRVLSTNGFVRRMANRGYAVRQANMRELEELYEVRLALELYTVDRLASRGAPSKALDSLRETWQAVRAGPTRKGEELAELDTEFHERLAALIGNEMLLQQLKTINERLFVFRMIDFGKADRADDTCEQHIAILDKIAAQDRIGARDAIQRNIEDGRTIVGAAIKEALARAYAAT
jgi:DNA-binding GntR family transcriptional regulator